MRYERYIKAFISKLWLILLLPLVTGLITAQMCFNFIKPVYASNITLFIISNEYNVNSSGSYQEILMTKQTIKEYAQIIKSKMIAKAVIQKLRLTGISPEQLSSKLDVSIKSDTRMFEVSLKYETPQGAKMILEGVVEEFSKRVVDIMKVENVKIVDPAEENFVPVGSSYMKYIGFSVFAGFFGALCIIYLLEVMDKTIRDTEDIEKLLGIKVLCVVPKFSAGRK